VRALELAYANGAQRVYVVRVASEDGLLARYTLTTSGDPVIIESVAPGSGYNDALIVVGPGDDDDHRMVTLELGSATETLRNVPANLDEFVQVINGTHASFPFGSQSSTGAGSNWFRIDPGTLPDDPETITVNETAETGAEVSVEGTNGAVDADYTLGMAALENEDVHIVVLAGQDAGLADELVAHVENSSTDLMKHERIGVIGGDVDDAPAQDEGRLVYVRPGLTTTDSASRREVQLPASYTAAAVGGRLASLDAHFSLTNKTINAGGLGTLFNGTQLVEMIRSRVCVLERRLGSIRVVKGITTSTNTAWTQITTRRIVDYARYGVRSACDPYIGKLNNERVRQAMKSTITGFLTDMVDREMLISFELEVSATRAQQIRGIAQVTMIIRPTFSIDYIRVIMFLE